jgi:hypothetical protein
MKTKVLLIIGILGVGSYLWYRSVKPKNKK